MQRVIERLMANGFSELAGLGISGTVPLKQDLINELLAGLLAETQASPGAIARSPAALDPKALLRLVKKLEVSASPGTVTVSFELKA